MATLEEWATRYDAALIAAYELHEQGREPESIAARLRIWSELEPLLPEGADLDDIAALEPLSRLGESIMRFLQSIHDDALASIGKLDPPRLREAAAFAEGLRPRISEDFADSDIATSALALKGAAAVRLGELDVMEKAVAELLSLPAGAEACLEVAEVLAATGATGHARACEICRRVFAAYPRIRLSLFRFESRFARILASAGEAAEAERWRLESVIMADLLSDALPPGQDDDEFEDEDDDSAHHCRHHD